MHDHFDLVALILETKPSEFVACFSHKEYFAEYGYKSSGFDYRWVWIRERLLSENDAELERLLALSKA